MKNNLKGLWIPDSIRRFENLTLQEVVLFSSILALSKKHGKSYATNKYYGRIIKVSKSRASNIISSLKKKNLIRVEIDKTNGNKRFIYPNVHIPGLPYVYNHIEGIDTSQTNDNIKDIKEDNITIDRFEKFWDLYPKKVGRKKALEEFFLLEISEEKFKEIICQLETQLHNNYSEGFETRFIPNPANWLKDERWLDEVDVTNKQHKKTDGALSSRIKISEES